MPQFLMVLLPFISKAWSIFQFGLSQSFGPFMVVLSHLMFGIFRHQDFIAKALKICLKYYSKSRPSRLDGEIAALMAEELPHISKTN